MINLISWLPELSNNIIIYLYIIEISITSSHIYFLSLFYMNIKLTISQQHVFFQVCVPLCIHNKWTSLRSTINEICTYNKHVGILCNVQCIIDGIMRDTLIEEKDIVSKLDSQTLRSTMCLLEFYLVTFSNYMCNTVKNLRTSSFGCIKSCWSSLKQWRRSLILNQRMKLWYTIK